MAQRVTCSHLDITVDRVRESTRVRNFLAHTVTLQQRVVTIPIQRGHPRTRLHNCFRFEMALCPGLYNLPPQPVLPFEYELSTDRAGGRRVRQCGSTFGPRKWEGTRLESRTSVPDLIMIH